ncbi:ZapG family protein [Candidatus Schneideria nysicola]|uniref:ZapG family protein n=1 Tax=Candidatus Schneideria nysicola TaxID=1081631 RepID=UPI001CAA696E|nr:DUF1043 family protein [Candidatus Schneideria nysicola]UAJ65240.1 DUF1043 family protein [Candidatus Schneideria nysicola]UAJ65777.1 DUF1043 family protein [Candidatus Schneideria nysicola]UAJ66303.1 DUF1043 family protein [Candidatus Schneideria nysicola]
MNWQYGLIIISLIIGIIIGIVIMRIKNRKSHKQEILQYELEKSKVKLDFYQKELSNYFSSTKELLDNMAEIHNQFYHHILESSNKFLLNQKSNKSNWKYRLTEAESDNDQIPIEIKPQSSKKEINPDLSHS